MANDKAKTLRDRTAEFEAQSRDVAQKIWLAGLGAYGRAFSEAIEGAQKLNENTSELFEDLVKRGTEIEGDMKSRISSNERVQQATETVSKVTETALRLQREQRERFEARMQRMRALLGFSEGGNAKSDELNAKLDRLEEEIAELSARTAKTPGTDKAVATRLARLGAEISAIAEVNAPKKKTVKKAPATKAAAKAPAKKATATKAKTARKTAKA